MSLITQYDTLFVGRDEGQFVENYIHVLSEGEHKQGKIFISIEIQNNPADAEQIGELVGEAMRKHFFAELEGDPYTRFEDAVRLLNRELTHFKQKKNKESLGKLNIVIGAIVENTLYLSKTGDAETYLIRRHLCTNVTENLAEEDEQELFTNIASGTLEPGDFILICSTRLLRYITKNDLAKICASNSPTAALHELKDYLITEVLSKVGCIGISVQGAVAENAPKREPSDVQSATPATAAAATSTSKSDLVADLKNGLSDVVDWFQKLIRKKRPLSLNVSGLNKQKLAVLIVGGIFVLGGSIWWLRSRANEEEKIRTYNAQLTEIAATIDAAQTTGEYSKEQASELLKKAEGIALELLEANYKTNEVQDHLQRIEETSDQLDNIQRPQPQQLVDLSEKRSNVSALGIVRIGDMLYAYEYNALYPIQLDKLLEPIKIDENEEVVSAAVYNDKKSILFSTASGKIIEYLDGQVIFLDTSDGRFKDHVAIQTYSNRLYLLDPKENQIWRYLRKRDSFDTAEAYNINGEIQTGVNLAIDGSIYVLHEDGYITKLFSGNKEDFPLDKQPLRPMQKPTKIITNENMDQIYILEPTERRVLVYSKKDKGASYEKQFVFDQSIGELRDILVNKDTNKLYLLTESKVYTVDL